MDSADRLDRLGETDAAIDIIFDQIDEMLLAGEFDKVDKILTETKQSNFSVELLIAMLTVTLPAKNKLSKRFEFFEFVRQSLLDRDIANNRLLIGLD